MPREVKTLVYKYEELSDKAKKNAIEEGKTVVSENFGIWHTDFITEQLCAILEEKGLPQGMGRDRKDSTGTVEWSLGYCQGDGVAFYGPIDLAKITEVEFSGANQTYLRKFLNLCKDNDVTVDFCLRRNAYGHHYSHYNTMYVDYCSYASAEQEDIIARDIGGDMSFTDHLDNIASMLREVAKDVSQDLESKGYDWIEAEYEDENIIAMFEANEYEFDEDGNIV